MVNKKRSTIEPGAVDRAANALARTAIKNLPVLRQGEDDLVAELLENKNQYIIGFDPCSKPDVTVKSGLIPVKDCSTCHWGDWMAALQKHTCWALEATDAEICRANNHSSWEPKKEGGRGCD